MVPRSLRTLATVPLFALCLTLTGCGDAERTSAPAPVSLPDQVVDRFVLTETVVGAPQWSVTAPQAIEVAGGTITILRPRLVTYEENGEIASTLQADTAIVNRLTHDMRAHGHVVMRNTNGVTVQADSLSWLNAARQVRTLSTVRIRKGESVLYGRGFESDANLHSYRILGDLRAHVVTSDEIDER